MNVTKSEIINGVVKFAKNEVIDKIPDKALKMIIATGVSVIEINPEVADNFFNNPMVSTILKEEDGKYNLDKTFEIVEKTLTDYGDFPVKIPPIKFLSPNEKELTFSLVDVSKLKEYISRGDD